MTERQWQWFKSHQTLRLHGEKENRHFELMAAEFDHIAIMKVFRETSLSLRRRFEPSHEPVYAKFKRLYATTSSVYEEPTRMYSDVR